MKRTIKHILYGISVLGAGIVLYSHCMQQHEAQGGITAVNFVIDYKIKSMPDNDVILADLHKVIKASGEHIFINPLMWRLYLDELETGHIAIDRAAWQMYDTTIGLLCLKHKDADMHCGINYDQFTLIEDPFDGHFLPDVVNRNWTGDLHKLVDTTIWRRAHKNKKALLYVSGHGSDRATAEDETAILCGLPEDHMAKIFAFFNDQAPVDVACIQSCSWTAQRLFDLVKATCNTQELAYTIISPLQTEEILWLTSLEHANCACENCEGESFFDCCRTATGAYDGQNHATIKDIIYGSDTVRHNSKLQQSPTILAAGTQTATIV